MLSYSGQTETTGSGTITALNGAVTAIIPTSAAIAFQVTGTWSATLIFEASVDGTNYFTVPGNIQPAGTSTTTTTINNAFTAGIGGYQSFRIRASVFTSGTVAIAWNADSTPNIQSTVQDLNINGAGASAVNIQDGGNSITVDGTVSVSNLPTTQDTNYGTPTASTVRSASMLGVGSTAVSNSNPVPMSDAGGSITVDGSVAVNNASGAAAVNIQDGGNSITVDGTVLVSNLPATSDTNFGTPGASTLRSAAMLGVGSTAVSNANPVPVSDAGGSITVDGTVAVTQSTSPWVENLTQVGGASLTLGQKTSANSIPVVLSSDDTVDIVPGFSAKRTYSASFNGLVTVATPTDVFTLTGSATQTIRIQQIRLIGTSSAGGHFAALLIKRSAANTAGTSTTATNVPLDSTSAAGTATVRGYTANPSALGAAVGTVRSTRQLVSGAVTVPASEVIWTFGDSYESPLVIRGTSEVIAVNYNSVTITGSLMNFWIQWTEE